MAHELPALPEAFVYGPPIDVAGAICEQKRPRYFSVNQMRDYATAHAASLEAEVERLREALYLALPFVEDCEGTTYYKKGTVRNAVRTIRTALGEPLK